MLETAAGMGIVTRQLGNLLLPEAGHDAFRREFGPDPGRMTLQAIVFEATCGGG